MIMILDAILFFSFLYKPVPFPIEILCLPSLNIYIIFDFTEICVEALPYSLFYANHFVFS